MFLWGIILNMWIRHTVTGFVQELLEVLDPSVQNLLFSSYQTDFFLFGFSWLWLISFIKSCNFPIKLPTFIPCIISLHWLQFFWHLLNVSTQRWQSITLNDETVSSALACTSQCTICLNYEYQSSQEGIKKWRSPWKVYYFCLTLIQALKCFQISVKIPNMKFHVDPSCRSFCSMQTGRWTNGQLTWSQSFLFIFIL